MAEYRTIRMAFWTDPYIEELETEAKLLYVYLFTSPHTNNLGILEATRRKIAYETGISIEKINKCLVKFANAGKIVIDEEHNALLLTRFIKHQTTTSPKIAEGLKKLFPLIPSKRFADTLSALYPTVFNKCEYRIDTVSIPYQTQDDTLSIPYAEKEREDENKLLCAELDKPATPHEVPAVATLPLSNGEDYPITQEQIAEWSKVFPAVDIPYQLGRMKVWCEANPKKKKTRRGILKFVTNWLGNRQDKGGDKTQTEMDTPAPVWVDQHKEHHEILNEIADKYGSWGPDYYHGETDEEYEIREEKMIAEAVKRGVPEDYARGDSHD